MSKWPTERLKHLADVNKRVLDESTPPEREIRYLDISAVGRGVLTSEPQTMKFGDAPSRARRLVSPGDTIVSTVRTYLRAVWPVSEGVDDLVVSTGFAVLSPRQRITPQYFAWVVQSDPFIEEVVSRSVGVSYPAINPSEIQDIAVPLPPLSEQRAITDFLDREAARIDALIAAKRRMIELLQERVDAAIEDELWSNQATGALRAQVELRRTAARIDVGIAEAATHAYVDRGVPLLRSTNVRPNRLDTDDLLFVAPWFAERNRSKYMRAGDILTVRTGNVGVSAIVPPEFDKSQCFTQLITTPLPSFSSEFLCFALNSRRCRSYFALSGWGSAQSNISVPLLASAPVPSADTHEQLEAVAAIQALRARASAMSETLARQVGLLVEHRNAVITAAVTGEIGVPGVAA